MESFFLDNLFIGDIEAQKTIAELKRDVSEVYNLKLEQNIIITANANTEAEAVTLFFSFITQLYNPEEYYPRLPFTRSSLIKYNDTDDVELIIELDESWPYRNIDPDRKELPTLVNL